MVLIFTDIFLTGILMFMVSGSQFAGVYLN